MKKPEKIFWGITAISGLYIVLSTSLDLMEGRASAQMKPSAPQEQQVAPAPSEPVQGMGCAMGGGCGGCAGMEL